MEKLTIHGTPPSAREMIAALSQFRPEVVSVDGHQELVVGLGGDPAELVAVLHALEKYLAEQANGPLYGWNSTAATTSCTPMGAAPSPRGPAREGRRPLTGEPPPPDVERA